MSQTKTIAGHEVQLIAYPDGEVRPTDFRIVSAELPELRPGSISQARTKPCGSRPP